VDREIQRRKNTGVEQSSTEFGYLLETLRSPTQLLDAGATTTSRSDADHALNLIDGGALRQSAAQCAAFDFYADGASERLRLNTRGENAVAFPVDSTSST
jgi:hypothetical protein